MGWGVTVSQVSETNLLWSRKSGEWIKCSLVEPLGGQGCGCIGCFPIWVTMAACQHPSFPPPHGSHSVSWTRYCFLQMDVGIQSSVWFLLSSCMQQWSSLTSWSLSSSCPIFPFPQFAVAFLKCQNSNIPLFPF